MVIKNFLLCYFYQHQKLHKCHKKRGLLECPVAESKKSDYIKINPKIMSTFKNVKKHEHLKKLQ